MRTDLSAPLLCLLAPLCCARLSLLALFLKLLGLAVQRAFRRARSRLKARQLPGRLAQLLVCGIPRNLPREMRNSMRNSSTPWTCPRETAQIVMNPPETASPYATVRLEKSRGGIVASEKQDGDSRENAATRLKKYSAGLASFDARLSAWPRTERAFHKRMQICTTESSPLRAWPRTEHALAQTGA